MVYLLHFRKRLKHARHYLGETKLPLGERLEYHKRGHGARIMKAAYDAGVGVVVARRWVGPGVNRDFERRLKTSYRHKQLCPICSGRDAFKRGKVNA